MPRNDLMAHRLLTMENATVTAKFGCLLICMAAACCLPVISATAHGLALTDEQLDKVTAGGVFVASDVNAQAIAAYRSSAVGLSNTITGGSAGVEQGFQSEGGLASGTAVTFGFNGANTSAPAPSTSSSVATGGVADGNFNVNITGGGSVSALGLTIQGAFTSVYGVFVPGL